MPSHAKIFSNFWPETQALYPALFPLMFIAVALDIFINHLDVNFYKPLK